MLALFIAIAVFACTFVGMNERLEGGAKGGFYATFAIVVVVVGLLSWLLS